MTPGKSESTPAARGRVLLVDDERALLDTMSEGLGTEFEVETAATAAEAELLMATRSYAVVVCDHLMPGEAGLDFLVRMRDRHPETRRILITGYMNPELLSRSVTIAQLSACLLKPVNLSDLIQAVRGAVGEK